MGAGIDKGRSSERVSQTMAHQQSSESPTNVCPLASLTGMVIVNNAMFYGTALTVLSGIAVVSYDLIERSQGRRQAPDRLNPGGDASREPHPWFVPHRIKNSTAAIARFDALDARVSGDTPYLFLLSVQSRSRTHGQTSNVCDGLAPQPFLRPSRN